MFRRLIVTIIIISIASGHVRATVAPPYALGDIPDPPYPETNLCGKAPESLLILFRMGRATPVADSAELRSTLSAWAANLSGLKSTVLIRGRAGLSEAEPGSDLASRRAESVRATMIELGVAQATIWTQTVTTSAATATQDIDAASAEITATADTADCERTLAVDRAKWFVGHCLREYRQQPTAEELQLRELCFVAMSQLQGYPGR